MLTVNGQHLPNGVLLPCNSYYRTLRSLRIQLACGLPLQKRLWQSVVRHKIGNQADLLQARGQPVAAQQLRNLQERVRPADPDNFEAQAAQKYFVALFGADFRRDDARFYNAALNYAYALLRAAQARVLVAQGLQPACGIHHCNELNPFNLADDMMEPWRPLLDAWVLQQFPQEEAQLTPQHKGNLLNFLHQDVALSGLQGRCSVLAALEHGAQSLIRAMDARGSTRVALHLPLLHAAPQQAGLFEADQAPDDSS